MTSYKDLEKVDKYFKDIKDIEDRDFIVINSKCGDFDQGCYFTRCGNYRYDL